MPGNNSPGHARRSPMPDGGPNATRRGLARISYSRRAAGLIN
jgi:hypothetical protein